MSTSRRQTSLLLVAVLLAGGAVGAVAIRRQAPPPPVSPSAAGLEGDVWVMPSTEVMPFLQQRGVTAQAPPVPGTSVVVRVAWSPRSDSHDEYFTVMLGDVKGRSGIIDASYGPAERSVALGSGSMWQRVLGQHEWLAGDRDLRSPSGGFTSYGQFASVPSDWPGDVWLVGRVVDPATVTIFNLFPEMVQDPQPVVGVALSHGDHAWWVQEVAR